MVGRFLGRLCAFPFPSSVLFDLNLQEDLLRFDTEHECPVAAEPTSTERADKKPAICESVDNVALNDIANGEVVSKQTAADVAEQNPQERTSGNGPACLPIKLRRMLFQNAFVVVNGHGLALYQERDHFEKGLPPKRAWPRPRCLMKCPNRDQAKARFK